MSADAGRAPRRRRPGRRVRLHIQNSRKQSPVFWITRELYEAAARRHPALARRLDTTMGWERDEYDAGMATAEILIGWNFPRDGLAALAPRLRWIQLTSAGIEHLLPLDWLPARTVLTNNAGVHAAKAGEYAVMALLMLNNQIPGYVTKQQHRRWERSFNSTVAGKTLAVIGVGRMGGAVAAQAKRLKLHVLGIRRTRRPHRHVDEMFGPDELDRVLPRADFVCITAPLTRETRGLLDRRQLDRLPPHAGLLNLGRAAIVDYEALCEKLTKGELSGAVLDVFDPEPLPADSPVWRTPNLVMTPHVSSDDAARYTPLTLDLFFDNLRRFLAGRRLRNEVSRARLY
jgi:phosphoglycerate dehydrogenase-like enzyme